MALQAWLDQVHAFWTEQLGSFKEHAETDAEERREPGSIQAKRTAPTGEYERGPSGPARRAKSGNNA